MICKYCGAPFNRGNLSHCPYCDMEIDEIDNESEKKMSASQEENISKWNLDKLTEKRVYVEPSPGEEYGTVIVTVKGTAYWFSPATGVNYVIEFDDGNYQIRLSKGDQDISDFLKLPVGTHEGVLKYYSWRDTAFEHPEFTEDDRFSIVVRKNQTTEITIKTGTVLLPRKIEVK